VTSASSGVLGVAAIAILALVGCGEATHARARHDRPARASQVGWQSYESRRWGYRVIFPAGWHRATHSLTPNITDPVEILSVATFPLRTGQALCGVAGALARVRPAGALVTIQERGIGAYGGPDFPPRPVRFQPNPQLPGRSEWPYCAAVRPGQRRWSPRRPVPMLDYYFGFGDAGRAFHVLVAIGRTAPKSVRSQAFWILDRLWLDPSVKPRWRSSG
jgi:hypothetical protein